MSEILITPDKLTKVKAQPGILTRIWDTFGRGLEVQPKTVELESSHGTVVPRN